jgi:quercetin dioxygenase-like cupin family protein
MQPFMLTLESGASSGPSPIDHGGHEFVICLRGKLDYQIENEHFVLEAGDSLLFAAHLRHRWRNPGKTVATVLFVLAGFAETERPVSSHIVQEDQES